MIEAVVFDWAGTTVDYGCIAPVEAFRKSFADMKISVTNDEIREPMGMLEIDHIRAMLAMPRIYDTFYKVYNRAYDGQDVLQLHKSYEKHLMATISQHTKVKPYVIETVDKLREMNVKIGSTTGYTNEMMQVIVEAAKLQGYEPDFWISPDGVNQQGRPKPFMLFKNMEELQVDDVRKVVKVGDTIADIEEGKHAGVYTVGVLEGSSLVALSEAEAVSLDEEAMLGVLAKARNAYLAAGANAVIMNLKGLIPLVKRLQKK